MIKCVPTPAIDGSNVPVTALVMPFPVQTPPRSREVSDKDGDDKQHGPTGEMVASALFKTVMEVV